MLSSPTSVQEIIEIVPEWGAVLRGMDNCEKVSPQELFNRLGAAAIYRKAMSLTPQSMPFLKLLRDQYFQAHIFKMLSSNQNLKRFWGLRHVDSAQQRQQALSLSVELSQKMEGALLKHLNARSEDGHKVLLPPYIQRTVHNAVIDYIRQEWSWERHTLQDMHLDQEQEDPRQKVSDDAARAPENMALSREQAGQLNLLNKHLKAMLSNKELSAEPFLVIDCMFGLGLSQYSRAGQEMTMRECCDLLEITGETQARRIARCQVLLDKGLDLIRNEIRQNLPGLVEAWQGELNVNKASRRELTQQLGMTEGEVERLVKARQYYCLEDLVERQVVKANRLPDLAQKGAVAAFVPVDLNSATARDLSDILGLGKELAQKLVAERPFANLQSIVDRKILDQQLLDQTVKRGGVLRLKPADELRVDLNSAALTEFVSSGLSQDLVTRVMSGRPFLTWSDLDEYLACDAGAWSVLRTKFCLGLPG